jgi:metal-responsive CopG/Arc/MetJ family transcriptional regulator
MKTLQINIPDELFEELKKREKKFTTRSSLIISLLNKALEETK